MTDLAIDQVGAPRPTPAEPHLGWVVAGLSAAAGVIHFVEVPAHAGGSLLDPLGFAAFGWLQLVVAAAVLADRAGKRLYALAAVVNVAALGLWLWSRTSGLPFGTHQGIVEDIGLVDGTCAALEVGVVLLALRLVLAPERRTIGRLAPVLVAVAALGLTTSVIATADPSAHTHGSAAAALTAHDARMQAIDATRCDEHVNVAAYWDEADYLGVDTRMGGTMAADTGAAPTATSSDGHDHGGTAAAVGTTTTTEPDPTAGRGTAALDGLVADTSLASGGEGAAATLVVDLGEADQDDYDAWLWWLRASGSLSHSHATTTATASGDTGGHGGHVGPQPWTALTDARDCAALDRELAEAREVAMALPTAADATAAGYHRVTTYVPGIAAHYMKFGNVDGRFELDEPEMVLYDGNGPDAHVVGLSYYLIQPGTSEPTQGFTGANDHGHRHIGLCQGAGGVIGDSTLTAEECAARGGRKGDGSQAWMIHAWVVPGCESPWGVFSAASPVLDGALGDASGTNDGGCSASAVRGRYGLDEPAVAATSASADEAKAGGADDDETAGTTGD